MPLPYRSLLFVPADAPERLEGGFASGADAVVADLEDAVPLARKDAARGVLADRLPGLAGAARLVRINGPETGLAEADLQLLAGLELDAIVLPKATPETVAALGPDGPPLIAIIESAAGLRLAYEVACAPRVHALILGAADLSADLGLEPRPDALELLYARSKVVADSAAAGVRPPFDRVFGDPADPAGLEADARFARSLGFGGKGCTHVAQPGVVNRVFSIRAGITAADKAAMFAP
jgi:citrate lyase subunit beta/citryl-CoA lyase